ncbi:hypothetical protein [Ornithinicoccus halotolerans]|uniref:hypothetical protein n=1 Tax=Ornithinicoccus halotolerans TaxID=1748220 RepID=UPI0012952800|nr:hypothetical protein [Ornithinicoccus halotolerans]
MTRLLRRLALPLLLVGALAGVPLLAPTAGGTQARWSDTQDIALGTVANDNLGLSLTADQAVTSVPGSTTVRLVNESTRLQGSVHLQGSATRAGTPVAGLSVQYTAGGSAVQDVTVAPGQRRDVTLAVAAADQRQLLLAHAGSTVDVSTTAGQTSAAAPNWAGSGAVTTRHHIPFPRPTHPGGGQLEAAKVCQGAVVGAGTLRWAWPDSGVSSAQASPAVDRWTVERLSGGQWQLVTRVAGDARSASVSASQLVGLATSTWFRVVAHPAVGTGPVRATFEIELKQVLSLLIPVGVSCGAVRTA